MSGSGLSHCWSSLDSPELHKLPLFETKGEKKREGIEIEKAAGEEVRTSKHIIVPIFNRLRDKHLISHILGQSRN